jgi:hypothetical protein
MQMENSIIEFNKDVEQFVIQASASRSEHHFKNDFGDKFTPLEFVHTADIHADIDVWNRMVEYVNHYNKYISFVLHTGDFCGGSQKIYRDMYAEGKECLMPIYNCPGNHDCVYDGSDWEKPTDKAMVHRLLYSHTENWNVTFMDCKNSMSYYKDFPDSNIRLIVLDLYYDVWKARGWLRNILNDANKKQLHVITAMHERTNYIKDNLGVKYGTIDDYTAVNELFELRRETLSFDHRNRVTFEDIIAEFIKNGGTYVCNLAGHEHVDEFGITDMGILNVVVAIGTRWDGLGDMKRVDNTKSMDCFNVVAVDTDLGLLKIIRVGANVDHYLRKKTALCFDYINKKVISEI